MTKEELAKWLHDNYEAIAKEQNWDTQQRCKVEFDDLPDANKRTMIEIADRLLTSKNNKTAQLGIGAVSNSCLICGKELDKETAEHGNGTCSEYCNAKYSGYPMPSDYSEGLQKLVDNCC